MDSLHATKVIVGKQLVRLSIAFGLALLMLGALLSGLYALVPVQAAHREDIRTVQLPELDRTMFSASADPLPGGTLRLGALEPSSLDPLEYDGRQIAAQILDGLLAFDDNLNLMPAIATSWETADAQAFTFTLRSDVHFHNGRQLTAQDVVYSWSRLDDSPISNTTIISSTMLRVVLTQPEIQWLYDLPDVKYAIVPSETVSTIGEQPVGAGPFRFEGWTPGVAITLSANTDYYAGRPYVDRVVYVFYADEDAVYAAFQSGDVDLAAVPGSEYAGLEGDPNLVSQPKLGCTSVWLSTHLTPTHQITVRQALKHAIDKPAVISSAVATVPGYRVQADAFVLPGLQGYSPPPSHTHLYSPVLALDLFYSAGYTDTAPGDGLLDDGAGNVLTVALWTNTGNVARESAVSLIAEQWQDIGDSGVGVSVTMVLTDWNFFLGGLFSEILPTFVVGYTPVRLEPFDTLQTWFHTTGEYNFVNYDDAQVDAWLDQTETTISLTQRLALYELAEDKILYDTPVVPLWRDGYTYVTNGCVGGLTVRSNGDIPLERVHLCAATQTVAPGQGGTIVSTDTQGISTTIQIPEAAVTETTLLVYRTASADSVPPTSDAVLGFELDAYRGDVPLPGFTFEEPITLTIHYSETQLGGASESTLQVLYWTGSEWSDDGIVLIEHNTDLNYVICTIAHLTDFALIGRQNPVYLPTVLRNYP